MPDPLVPPLEPENITLGMNEATFEYLSRIWPRHERMFRVQSSLGETQYVLAHPDEVRQVLVAESRSYHKGKTFRNMKLLMGNGLIVQDGELWRRQRKLIQPLFHDRALHETVRVMRAHA
jgi:cytochrome P450